jgi:hypothetical protein
LLLVHLLLLARQLHTAACPCHDAKPGGLGQKLLLLLLGL